MSTQIQTPPFLPINITEPIPLNISLVQPVEIATHQYFDVDTGITQLGASNLGNPHRVSITEPVDLEVTLTNDPVAINLEDPHPVKITETFSVNTNITQLGASNLKNPHKVVISNDFEVNIGTTALWISNLLNTHPVSVPSEFQVNIGTTALWISNLDNPHKISIGGTVDVEAGITQLGASNLNLTHNVNINNDPLVVVPEFNEIGISSWNAPDPASVDIVDQNVQLAIQSGSSEIIDDPAAQELLTVMKNTVPYPEQFVSNSTLLYASQMRSHHFSTDVREESWVNAEYSEVLNGAVLNTDEFGLHVEHNNAGSYYSRRMGIFPWNGGKTMFRIQFTNPVVTGDDVIENGMGFIGLGIGGQASSSVTHVRFQSRNGFSIFDPPHLQIVSRCHIPSGGFSTFTIDSSQFNIDPLDGTGPSGFTWNYNAPFQELYIITDSINHYTFGVINDNVLFPCHVMFGQQHNLASIFGVRRLEMHPFWDSNLVSKNATGFTARKVYTSGFRIFKNMEISLPASFLSAFATTTNRAFRTSGNETHFISMRLTSSNFYSRNFELTSLSFYCSVSCRIKIYISDDSGLSLTNPAAAWDDLAVGNDLEIELTSEELVIPTGGITIFEAIYPQADEFFADLTHLQIWKQFARGRQLTPDSQKIVSISTQSLTANTTSDVNYAVTWRFF